jgi:hypothetical protein
MRRKPESRRALESPFEREHEASIVRVARSRVMPKDFRGLMAWLAESMALESVEKIHPARVSVWSEHLRRFRVTAKGDIICVPCGELVERAHSHPEIAAGSLLGSPDELGAWRLLMYGSPSATDEDGYYLAPVHRALSEFERDGRPLMARTIFAVVASGYDWRGVAERGSWADEQFRDYLTFALMRLWNLTIPRDERRVLD